MNFLAHAVLSFHDPEILFGQMISDFVKGKKQYEYPINIHQGITLHRRIDAYTDEHPVTIEAKQFFRPAYRLYSGAFVDIVYDHFLANDRQEFGDGQLFTFSQQVYAVLDRHTDLMPPVFAGLFPYMRRENWLLGYAQREGIYRSFRGLVSRSAFMTDSLPAARLFDKYYNELEKCYTSFWPDLKEFTTREIAQLKK
ncbi:MAG: ACP phosphodiesterase [Chitinophagaceae bacterium]